VTTLQFAQLCREIIKNGNFDDLRSKSFVYHFCPNKTVSKFELLQMFKAVLNKNIDIAPKENREVSVKRILTTKYDGLKNLLGEGLNIRDALNELFTESIKE